MEFIQTHISSVVAFLTLLSNIAFVAIVLGLLVNRGFRQYVYEFVRENVLRLLFSLSFIAVVGSLSYSNIVGFPPCELCWIQRILMYPQALVLFMAMLRKDVSVIRYLFPLSILGAIVAFYHSLAHWGLNSSLLDCTAVGGDCVKVYVLKFGYITIPFMSLSVFIYLIAISLIYFRAKDAR